MGNCSSGNNNSDSTKQSPGKTNSLSNERIRCINESTNTELCAYGFPLHNPIVMVRYILEKYNIRMRELACIVNCTEMDICSYINMVPMKYVSSKVDAWLRSIYSGDAEENLIYLNYLQSGYRYSFGITQCPEWRFHDIFTNHEEIFFKENSISRGGLIWEWIRNNEFDIENDRFFVRKE